MSLLSDELWLINNNSKSFANESKSILRNNLGTCKVLLFRSFENIVKDVIKQSI